MDSVSGADASHWNPENKEYESLREHSHNVLLEGPIALTDAALRLIVGSGEQIAWAGSATLGRINTAGQTFILRKSNPSAETINADCWNGLARSRFRRGSSRPANGRYSRSWLAVRLTRPCTTG